MESRPQTARSPGGKTARLLLALAVVLGVVTAMRAAGWPSGGAVSPPRQGDSGSGAAAAVALTVERPETPPLHASVPWRADMTVAEATSAAGSIDARWPSRWRGEGAMAFLESLAGDENQGAEGLNWQFEVNGQYATRGAGAVTLEPGDRVLWKLAAYE